MYEITLWGPRSTTYSGSLWNIPNIPFPTEPSKYFAGFERIFRETAEIFCRSDQPRRRGGRRHIPEAGWNIRVPIEIFQPADHGWSRRRFPARTRPRDAEALLGGTRRTSDRTTSTATVASPSRPTVAGVAYSCAGVVRVCACARVARLRARVARARCVIGAVVCSLGEGKCSVCSVRKRAGARLTEAHLPAREQMQMSPFARAPAPHTPLASGYAASSQPSAGLRTGPQQPLTPHHHARGTQ